MRKNGGRFSLHEKLDIDSEGGRSRGVTLFLSSGLSFLCSSLIPVGPLPPRAPFMTSAEVTEAAEESIKEDKKERRKMRVKKLRVFR
jgi:hypothetical protein